MTISPAAWNFLTRYRLGLMLLGLPFVALCAVWVVVRMVPAPAGLGLSADGRLAPCPDKPNCVSSQATDAEHAMSPMVRSDPTPEVAISRIAERILQMPRTKIVSRKPNYLHVEFRSALFGFVDDVEFYAPAEQKVVHFRSAARLGHSDLGVNRQRMESFFQ